MVIKKWTLLTMKQYKNRMCKVILCGYYNKKWLQIKNLVN